MVKVENKDTPPADKAFYENEPGTEHHCSPCDSADFSSIYKSVFGIGL